MHNEMKLIHTMEQVRQGAKAAGPLFPVCKSKDAGFRPFNLAMFVDTIVLVLTEIPCCYHVDLRGLRTHRALRACVRLVHLHLTAG
jgi:hypothetical protein|eukprot:COSAG02_NODE_5570_length_4223_cov_2.546314_3_plen_86_part_00